MSAHDLPTLDQLTSGVFTAETSHQRALLLKEWLASEPPTAQLQMVYKELCTRDKGAAKALKERLDEIKRHDKQAQISQAWAVKAQALLAQKRLAIADAMAWARDAQNAGAVLDEEPFLHLQEALQARIQNIEQLQTQFALKRESAALFVQRLEVLSTQSITQALGQKPKLREELHAWLANTQVLTQHPQWADVDLKLPVQLQENTTKLQTLWSAFEQELATAEQALRAVADSSLAHGSSHLPSLPVWADEIRALRMQSALALGSNGNIDESPIDAQQQAALEASITGVLHTLEQELEQGHGKATANTANHLRHVLREHAHAHQRLSPTLEAACQSALAAAGELEDWQRWRADQIREQLLARAITLVSTPLPGKQQQDVLRQLREQWRQADQGGAATQALWRKFDDACNEAHKTVAQWLDKIKAQSAAVVQKRQALIEELKAWGEAQKTPEQQHSEQGDAPPPPSSLNAEAQPLGNRTGAYWRATVRTLHAFGDRWRDAGHLSERDFEALNTLWKTTLKTVSEPLVEAQNASKAQRHALIEQAKTLAEGPLHVDAIKALQAQWQTLAQAVPLDRKLEDKLWNAFKAPIDAAFARKDEARAAAKAAHIARLSAHDQAVIAASQALEQATGNGEAQAIQAAMSALQAALQGQAATQTATATTAAKEQPATTEAATPSTTATVAVLKPVIAVRRGDDRTPSKPPVTSADKFGKRDRSGKKLDERPARHEERTRAPRLSEDAFHAQRRALETAQSVLYKLREQTQGEQLSVVLKAWQARQAQGLATLPSSKTMTSAMRALWVKSLSPPQPEPDAAGGAAAAAAAHSVALLRLEMASGAPTPADQLAARRQLQLQLLTRRNDPAPSQTWASDLAVVLRNAYNEADAKRVQAALKILLK